MNALPPDSEEPLRAMQRRLQSLAADASRLAELHVRLLSADLRAIRNGTITALAMLVLALCLLIAVLPTALAGVGLLVAEHFELSAGAGLLWSVLGAVIVMACLLVAARWLLRKQRGGLDRSQAALQESLKSLRESLSLKRDS
jgi:hypothetical protein